MSRIRVLDLAKELGIETKTAIVKLQELGIQVKNHFNVISETEATKLRTYLKSGKGTDKDTAQKAGASKLIIRRKIESAPEAPLESEPSTQSASAAAAQPPKTSDKASSTKAKPETELPHAASSSLSESSQSTHVKEAKQAATSVPKSSTQGVVGSKAKEAHTSVGLSQLSPSVETVSNELETVDSLNNKSETNSVQPANPTASTPSSSTANKIAKQIEPNVIAGATTTPTTTTTTPQAKNSASSAVIVRKAEPTPPQQFSRPSNTYNNPSSGNDPSRQNADSRPRYGAAASGQRDNRSHSGSNVGGQGNRPSYGGGGYQGSGNNQSSPGSRPSYNRDGNNQSSGGYNRDANQGSGGYNRDANQGSGGYNRDANQGSGGYNRDSNQGSGGYNRDANQGSGSRPQYQARPGGGAGGQSYERPQYQPGGAPRPGAGGQSYERSSGVGNSRPPSPSGSKPFVMQDTTTTTTHTKDVPSRLKDRDREKDREKRKLDDEENARNRAKAKGIRHSNDTDEFDVYSDLASVDVGDEEHSVVRTMIPNRKKSASQLRKKEVKRHEVANPTKASKKVIRIDEHITVNDLAGELSQKASAVIKSLMKLGMMASINQQLDFDTASFVAQEFGFEAQSSTVSIGEILSRKVDKNESQSLDSRPPIITIMGHVDHGKTSILDAIRSANVAGKEAGGITQHIGAYQIEHKGRKLTFLDTPGHEAFTSMRSRGAQITDIVILVVAADDGVMPQTVEAIAHAKAAGVPIIVAINKIDKPGINLDRINRELADKNILPEEWGGDTLFVQVSAKTRQGLDDLVDAILLQADVLELKANKNCLAEGVVIESKLDKARGPVATIIVTKGVLKLQDFIVAGTSMGRIRAMNDDLGNKVTIAEPATPVEIIGLDEVPAAGDQFNCVISDSIAKEAVAYRIEKQRQKELAANRGSTMEDLLAMMGSSQDKIKELSIIIKTDTHGSAEAIRSSVQKLDTAKVKTKIIHSAVGGITETDAILAKASRAIIIGFNVRPDRAAAQIAEQSGIKIQCFSIIYELLTAIQAAMLGSLDPIKMDKVIGHAEIRNTFSVPKIGLIAGSMISDGKITRNSHVRIVRDGIVVYTGKVSSLKRFKDDAKEVLQGFECGIGVENYNDLKVGDVLEAFIIEEIAQTLN